MILALLLALQAAASVPDTAADRFERCRAAAAGGAIAEAELWRMEGGGTLADQCLGLAHAAAGRYPEAATAFERAARASEAAQDGRAARLWAQAGNSRLAGDEPALAVTALDEAIRLGPDAGELAGEVHLDRARAMVALNREAEARRDLDAATRLAPRDPLAWLLSATLARRMGDLDKAQADIAEAVARSPDDASVAVEAGLIAATAGNEEAARVAWTGAIQVQPNSPAAAQARSLLAQIGAPVPAAAPLIEGR